MAPSPAADLGTAPRSHAYAVITLLILFAVRFSTTAQNVASFNPVVSGTVTCLAYQTDGRILVGGSFTSIGGTPTTNLARLNPDGTLDSTFSASLGGPVTRILLLRDGRILIVGNFWDVGGAQRPKIARLLDTGSVDLSFDARVSGGVNDVILLPDNRIIIGGWFEHPLVQGPLCMARLSSDGVYDSTFVREVTNTVHHMLRLADGRFVVSGCFDYMCGSLAYVTSNGNVIQYVQYGYIGVQAFATPGENTYYMVGLFTYRDQFGIYSYDFGVSSLPPSAGSVRTVKDFYPPTKDYRLGINHCIAITTDQRVLTGGNHLRRRAIGINADWILPANGVGSRTNIFAALIQPNGDVIVAGDFSSINGVTRSGLARIAPSEGVVSSLSVDSSTIRWQRSGVGPLFLRATFEISTNGSSFTPAFEASKVTNGWELSGLTLPPGATVRGRGFISASGNSGGWYEEIGAGATIVTRQPKNYTNNAGSAVQLRITTVGSNPISFQWRKDGVNLAATPLHYGVHTAELTISNLTAADSGLYDAVVSNSFGSVTSQTSRLLVNDPFITSQPSNRVVNAGGTASLSVSAAGVPPLSYRWRKDKVIIDGATAPSLHWSNASDADVGMYDVIVSNSQGMVTSKLAGVTVNLTATDDSFLAPIASVIRGIAVQTDGKILTSSPNNGVRRFEVNGVIDPSFGWIQGIQVEGITMLPDGKSLLTGDFTTILGQTQRGIARVHTNGAFDTSFRPQVLGGRVHCVLIQRDETLYIGGSFTNFGTATSKKLCRVRMDGSVIGGFNAGCEADVHAIAAQTGGRLLVGGSSGKIGGEYRMPLARIYSDGSLDRSFASSINGDVTGVVVQPDDKILVCGYFSRVNGMERNALARLHVDGTVDAEFRPELSFNDVYNRLLTIALQADGKILIGGHLTAVAGQPRFGIARLHPDGDVDLQFAPAASPSWGSAIALQKDGSILAAGYLRVGNGEERSLARFRSTMPPLDRLTVEGANITWSRNGATPEVTFALFEVSTNGTIWETIGTGARSNHDWRITAASPPTHGIVRSRGWTSGGYWNASASLVQSRALIPSRLHAVVLPSGWHRLSFQSVHGAVHDLQYATDLPSANWVSLGSRLGFTGLMTVDVPPADSARFYRLESWLTGDF